jgi:predicted RNA-binding Zn-ribbon protein involved in translation (DUF1610 family)
MKIVNGIIQYEMRECIMCVNSATPGKRAVSHICPNDGTPQRGKACATCGATTKRHSYYKTGEIVPCGYCKGTMQVLETSTDYASKEIWNSLEFKVFRSERAQTMRESLFGLGVYSCTDYGDHKKLTDSELIEKVRNSGPHQVCKFINELGKILSIGIFCNSNGYSVVAYSQET